MICLYLTPSKAGEILDAAEGRITDWATWIEYDCTNPALNEGGCPNLDNFDIGCPIKENTLKRLEDWAIRKIAGDRENKFTRVQELMLEDEG